MALPINIKDLLNNRIPFHPDFMGDVLVDVQVNVQVELADIEAVIRKMSESCPSYVLVLPKPDIEKLANCLLRCSTEISGRNMLDGIDSTSYKQKKRRYLDKLLEMKLIQMTNPGKPTSRNQQYICTDLGRQIIQK